MKISASLRDEAATLLAMSANASAGYTNEVDELRFIGEAGEWSYASEEAIALAKGAMFACEGKHPDAEDDGWWMVDACEKAEAEALLRTGWTPPDQ